eukprot:6189549-Pleurochrysis_carterae.AAC.1
MGSITKVRVRKLVAQRGQGRDAGRDLTSGVAQPLVKVSSQTFVALRSKKHSAYRRARRGREEEEEIRAGRAPSPKKRRHEVAGDGEDRASGNLWGQEFLRERGQAKMTT